MDAPMGFLHSALLAFIQGITEFVPISSSGHLVLARDFFSWNDDGGLAFDTVLHGGSLVALLLYFRRECVTMCKGWISFVRCRAHPDTSETESKRRLLALIVVATIPAVIAGLIFKPFIASESSVRNTIVTGISMFVTGSFFFLAERKQTDKRGSIRFLHALLIGCAQVIALLPGASRSGWTIGAGLLCGYSRESSVRFSFLMAIPVIIGAIVLQIKDIASIPGTGIDFSHMALGFIISFAVSMGAIHFCIRYFRGHSLKIFAAYLICIGLLSVLLRW